MVVTYCGAQVWPSLQPPLPLHCRSSPSARRGSWRYPHTDIAFGLTMPQASSPSAATGAGGGQSSRYPDTLVLTQPDDWHLHLRDGAAMQSVAPFSAAVFHRAIIMPNLKPPVTTVAVAAAYRARILAALASAREAQSSNPLALHPLPRPLEGFSPLMTLYLTDATPPEEIRRAKASGFIAAVKLYPAGATTNSAAGVTDLLGRCLPALHALAEEGLPLLVHGEVTDASVDVFDREAEFLQQVLRPLLAAVPSLRVVLEHVTTEEAVDFVLAAPEGRVAASVTPQHLLWNRNALFTGGIRPHHYCLPVLKRERHRRAIVEAVTSGSRRFFLGTDSAPHERATKEAACGCAGVFSAHAALPLYAEVFEQAGALQHLEAFASFNGPDFYRLPRNSTLVKLVRDPWVVPASYGFGDGHVVPMLAGEEISWKVETTSA